MQLTYEQRRTRQREIKTQLAELARQELTLKHELYDLDLTVEEAREAGELKSVDGFLACRG